jgi:hypothetical protein
MAILLSALLLPGCAALEPEAGPRAARAPSAERPGWTGIAEADDLGRLQRLDSAWASALSDARAARLAGRVAAEGELLEPGAALPRPAPPPGSYRCRLLKLGRHGGAGRALTAHPSYFCHVGDAGELLAFTKQTGSERPGGYLYPDQQGSRLVFLGALARGREAVPAYGEQKERDLIGIVERIAPFRWRLVLPWPRSGATIEVMELVPALP